MGVYVRDSTEWSSRGPLRVLSKWGSDRRLPMELEPESADRECDHEDLDTWAARLPPAPASDNVAASLAWLCDTLNALPIATLYPQLLSRMLSALILWPSKLEPKEWERCVRKGRIAKELNEVAPAIVAVEEYLTRSSGSVVTIIGPWSLRVRVCARARAFAPTCVRACVRACVCARGVCTICAQTCVRALVSSR
jgi:hypothetical protein